MTALLKVSNLVTEFGTGKGQPGLKAVNDVSFTVERGKVLGLVGESGSGKSVTGFSIMRLLEKPGRIAGGQIVFDGTDIANCSHEEMRQLRGKRIAMVFQDPTMTLNPVLTIGTQMMEAVQAHDKVSKDAARQRSRDALALVGIPSPEERLSAYPHQFSGGMRQRVAIAIALLHKPDLIIADEPTTALDVTIQSLDHFRIPEADRRGQHGRNLDHPRSRDRLKARGRRRGDVCRPPRRDRSGGQGADRSASSLHRWPDRLRSFAEQARRTTASNTGNDAGDRPSAAGLSASARVATGRRTAAW